MEPKLRFRAFTVAKLGTAEEIEKAKQILIRALKDGETYAATWQTVKETLNGKGTLNPNYWETVFRTNTQSAYIAGKLQKYQETNVKAFQLMVIEDSRTSPFCRSLLDKTTGYGMILPVNHQFWKTYGFPPYHFNCRTSICPVYGSMIGKAGYNVDNPSMNSFRRSKFKPQKGFGGNPLERGNWWDMTENQKKLAEKYGLMDGFVLEKKMLTSDFDEYKKRLSEYNLSLNNEVVNLDKNILEELISVIEEIGISEMTDSIKIMAPVVQYVAAINFNGELKLNLIYMKDKSKLIAELSKGVEKGLFPKNCNTVKSMLYHELFGHGSERFLLSHSTNYVDKKTAWINCSIAEEIVTESVSNILKINPELSANILREQICTAALDTYSETMAYGLEDVYINKKEAQPLSKEINRITMEHIRRIFK